MENDNKIFWQRFAWAYGPIMEKSSARLYRDICDRTRPELNRDMNVLELVCGTGQLLNLSSLARDVGVSQPTAERWLSILVASNIVYLLQPYFNNITKRAVKTPKLYFLDTGLAAYLTKWNTPDVLKNGAMAAHSLRASCCRKSSKATTTRGFQSSRCISIAIRT